MPTTNPTSTAIFKSLLSLKTRNALVLCPHPRAAKSTIAAARIVRDAAVAAGAPPNIISWVETPSLPVSQALMQATEINLILATGGPAMVRAAYSSGNPSLGVGAGNTPALIDETADVAMAVSSILLSKTFDNGVICASEQSVVVVAKAYDAVRTEFVRRGAYFLTEDDKVKVRAGSWEGRQGGGNRVQGGGGRGGAHGLGLGRDGDGRDSDRAAGRRCGPVASG